MVQNARGAAFVAAALVAGCDGGADGVRSVRTDSAGVEIVSYGGPDRPPPFALEETFRLGGSDTLPEQSFYQAWPGGVGADGAGNIYILEREASRVLVFDGDGRFLRSMGRAGGGPGELGFPAGLDVAADGTVGVIDFARRGSVRFAPDGSPLDVQPLPPEYYGGVVRTVEGAAVLPVRRTIGDAPTDALIRVAGADTTVLASIPPAPLKAIQLASCGMGFSGMPPLFSPTLRWDAAGDRVAVATGTAYDIALLEGGRETRRVRRDIAPAAATEALALEELGEAMQVRTEGGVRKCEPREVVEKRGYAEVLPAVGAVALSPDGWLWVQRGGTREAPRAVDVFDPTGEYAGTLPAGAPFPLLFLPDGRIAATEKDELDVTRLVVYRILHTPDARGD